MKGAGAAPGKETDLPGQILDAWHVNNSINLYLLGNISDSALSAVPTGSKGRTVGHQFAHMMRARLGWVQYNAPDLVSDIPKFPKAKTPGRRCLEQLVRTSDKAVCTILRRSLLPGGKVKSFKGSAVRWMCYLISHESHHRGQILLALKQSGMRLPERLAVSGMWGAWIWGNGNRGKQK